MERRKEREGAGVDISVDFIVVFWVPKNCGGVTR
jgi:hypothetical protein